MRLKSSSAEETERWGGLVADGLEIGDVVTVSGDLGTGKTTFVRGACRALGVTSRVSSPTYTIGHRYGGRVPVSHLDLYRFSRVSAEEWGDLEPYLEGAVVFIEWPEAAVEALPPPRLSVRLRHIDERTRAVMLETADSSLLERIRRGGHPCV